MKWLLGTLCLLHLTLSLRKTDSSGDLSMAELEKEMSGSELEELKKSEKELEMLQAKEKEEMGGEATEPKTDPKKKSYMNSASFQEHLKKRESKKAEEKDEDKLDIDDGQLKKFMSSLTSIASGKGSPLEDMESGKEASPSSASNQFTSQNLETVDKSLISVLKHPNVYSVLPQEVKNLIGKFERQYDLNLTQFT